MVNIAAALAHLFPNATPGVEYEIRDEGQGQFISEWNEVALGPQPSLEAMQAAAADLIKVGMWARIKAERDRRKFGGVLVSEKWIQTDTYSRTQWMAMVMMGASLPVISWTTMDGTTIDTTPELAQAVFQAVASMDATTFAIAKDHKASMEAAADPEAYDFSGNWMATFEG